ncbi:hypothetical protein IKF92_01965 [Candidatus Saccharibacteria bacterium]|nr:hypothetical protein [Candidatus Saccharibacteria bacterium]
MEQDNKNETNDGDSQPENEQPVGTTQEELNSAGQQNTGQNTEQQNTEQQSTEQQNGELQEAEQQSNDQQSTDQQSAEQLSTNQDATNTEQPAKKKSKKALVITLSAILVIGAGALIAILVGFPRSGGDEPAEDQSMTKELSYYEKLTIPGNELSDFDLAFIGLENVEDNMIYSPLSIKYALEMLADGANGDSKEQITRVIGEYSPKAYLNSKNRSFANAMFIRNDYADKVKKSYTNTLQTKYNADVILDSFNTPDTANKWVSDKTLGIIPEAFSEATLNTDIDYILTNALAIDMKWNNQLHCTMTGRDVPCLSKSKFGDFSVKYPHESYSYYINPVHDKFEEGSFNGKDNVEVAKVGASVNRYDIVKELGEETIRNTVQTEYNKWLEDKKNDPSYDEKDLAFDLEEYMSELKSNYGRIDESTDFYFNNTDDEVVFAKDLQEYDGYTLQYVGIMPKTNSLKQYISDLTAKKATSLISDLKNAASIQSYKDGVVTKISADIPFFEFEYEMKDLMDNLEKFGIVDVFSPGKADLSNMLKIDENSPDKPIIDYVMHKANIDFSNDGIKAAAVTALGGAGSAGGNYFEYEWDVPVEEIDLSFNKPFIFLIRDKASGEVWFAGTVYNLAN